LKPKNKNLEFVLLLLGRMDKMFFIKNFAKCIFQTFEKLFVIKEEVEHEVETEIDYPKIDEIQPDIIDYPTDLNNIYESNEMMEDFLMDRVSKNFLKTSPCRLQDY